MPCIGRSGPVDLGGIEIWEPVPIFVWGRLGGGESGVGFDVTNDGPRSDDDTEADSVGNSEHHAAMNRTTVPSSDFSVCTTAGPMKSRMNSRWVSVALRNRPSEGSPCHDGGSEGSCDRPLYSSSPFTKSTILRR